MRPVIPWRAEHRNTYPFDHEDLVKIEEWLWSPGYPNGTIVHRHYVSGSLSGTSLARELTRVPYQTMVRQLLVRPVPTIKSVYNVIALAKGRIELGKNHQ